MNWAKVALEVQKPRSNSYINLGHFEPMGADAGRAATGLAYLQETMRLQQEEREQEAFQNSARRASE